MNENKDNIPNSGEEPEGAAKVKWPAFVESSAVDFFMGYKLEKMQIEDGNGNKAKLSLTKDNEIRVEYSSVTIL